MRIAIIMVLTATASLTAADRPKILGLTNFATRVDNLEAARKFYTGVVGMDEAFTISDAAAGELTVFKINDHQYVEVSPTLKGDEDRMIHFGFETNDARAMRDYLASKGIAVPAKVDADANGNRSFFIKDPDGYSVQFVQYMPGSVHSRDFGKHHSPKRISEKMIHVGFRVMDPAKSDAFYKDVLGFRLLWKGGPATRAANDPAWISMMVTDGYDWVEYMNSPTPQTPKQLGVLNHYALDTKDMDKVYDTVVSRGYTPAAKPGIQVDGRMLLQLYDNNFTRTEMMIRKPVREPCCSPNLDDYKE